MGRYHDLSSGPFPNHGENFFRWRLLHLGTNQLSGFTDQLPGISSTKLSRTTQAGRWAAASGLAEFLGGVVDTLVSTHPEWSFSSSSSQQLLEPEALQRFFPQFSSISTALGLASGLSSLQIRVTVQPYTV